MGWMLGKQVSCLKLSAESSSVVVSSSGSNKVQECQHKTENGECREKSLVLESTTPVPPEWDMWCPESLSRALWLSHGMCES